MGSVGQDSATIISAGSALTAEKLLDSGVTAPERTAEYALRLGDDALILAQRLSWWISRAPEIEEDIALGNIALDTLGHARMLLTYAGTAWDRSEDDLAYFRTEEEFRCAQIVEVDNGDFGRTVAKNLIMSAYFYELYSRLVDSADETLAAIAAKAVKEVDYHLDHAVQWTLRLGIGTEESAGRMRAGLRDVWPYLDELFEDEPLHDDLEGIAVRPSTLRAPVMERLEVVLAEAELEVPEVKQARTGGRRGEHREALGFLLAEMQSLARQHPGATW
ncbi:1,2-phenylacetyl-CoA epoxidase subunit PaaC [Helcobacillus massiliensis]|nr:1,2-phenylacetyl-CoA epoxidase subunit PaaC [Helcobacillus massiliensis]MDK7741616.1 phenylacetate-CoA oxygenase subunit PaaC [Helcobacillus massiliensis]WOO94151.1 1,2-phenylacetyl-CoA epoxidase subunit PaaC [Helcobacillus massiliensis]